MIQIKKLVRPNKFSGMKLKPGGSSVWSKLGIVIVNKGPHTLYVDSVTPRKRRRKK